MADGACDPVSRREWEILIPDAISDPTLVIDPALPQVFRKLASADLHSVFNVDVRRETRLMESERAKIEVSLDTGAVIAGPDREPVHEIELELVDGSLNELFDEARRLSDAADGRLHARTKADIGYALTLRDHRHWSRAKKLHLTHEMRAVDAYQTIVRNSFAHLTANDDCARLNLHVEGVHQCRIALRRLRSAFKMFGPLLRRESIEPIENEVRELGRILGTARDLDVLQTDLLEPAITALGETEQLAPLMAGLEAQKAVAYAQVRAALSSPRYRHLLVDLCALGNRDDIGTSGQDAFDQPLAEFASQALTRAYRKLLKRGDRFEGSVESKAPRSQNRPEEVAVCRRFLRQSFLTRSVQASSPRSWPDYRRTSVA
jgi:inorganic triphosphatase YgiF